SRSVTGMNSAERYKQSERLSLLRLYLPRADEIDLGAYTPRRLWFEDRHLGKEGPQIEGHVPEPGAEEDLDDEVPALPQTFRDHTHHRQEQVRHVCVVHVPYSGQVGGYVGGDDVEKREA